MVAAAGYARRDVRTAGNGPQGITEATGFPSQPRHNRAVGLATFLKCTPDPLAISSKP